MKEKCKCTTWNTLGEFKPITLCQNRTANVQLSSGHQSVNCSARMDFANSVLQDIHEVLQFFLSVRCQRCKNCLIYQNTLLTFSPGICGNISYSVKIGAVRTARLVEIHEKERSLFYFYWPK
jgi:ribosomal protein S27E